MTIMTKTNDTIYKLRKIRDLTAPSIDYDDEVVDTFSEHAVTEHGAFSCSLKKYIVLTGGNRFGRY